MVYVDYEFAALYGYRSSSARRVGFAEFHLDALDTAHSAFVAENFHGIGEKYEFDTLFDCVVDFFSSCGHLFSSSSVDYVHLSAAYSLSGTRRIHCDVARTDNGYGFSAIHRSNCLFLVRLHKIYSRQEFVCRRYAVEVFALDVHKHRKSRARTYKYSVVLFSEFVKRNGFTDYGIESEFHSQSLEFVYFSCYYVVFGKSEFGDTVYEHAARFVESLEYRNLKSLLSAVSSTSESRGAASDNGYFFAVESGCFKSCRTFLKTVVAYVSLERADCYAAAEFGFTDTFALALIFLRTYSSANRGKQ